MPRKRGQLTPKQLAALAAGRERRTREAQARKDTAPRPRQKPLETAEDFIEAEGLDQPVERPGGASRPRAKAKPETMITPEMILASSAILNRFAVAIGGRDAAMTPDEAAGATAPMLRIGARAFGRLIERAFPDGFNKLEDGNLRDLSASLTSLGKYAIRQVGRVLWTMEARRALREAKGKPGASGPDTSGPPPAPQVVYNPPPMPDYDDEAPAPAMPDAARVAKNSTNGVLAGGMAALAGIVPTDTGQGLL